MVGDLEVFEGFGGFGGFGVVAFAYVTSALYVLQSPAGQHSKIHYLLNLGGFSVGSELPPGSMFKQQCRTLCYHCKLNMLVCRLDRC